MAMDVCGDTPNNIGSNLDDEVKKDTWDSLPSEIKRKIIKFASLQTRIIIKRVSKQCFEIATDLNNQQTTLVVICNRKVRFELPAEANSLCNLPNHTLDRTSIIRKPDSDWENFVKNFPNLVHNGIASLLSHMCRKLEHLSAEDEFGLTQVDMKEKGWTCLKLPSLPDIFFESSTLRFCDVLMWNDNVLAERLKTGLVGFSMEIATQERCDVIKDDGMDTEVLYNVDFFNDVIDTICQMPKLTTISGKGNSVDLASLGKLTGLTKLSWEGSEDDDEHYWTFGALHYSLEPWGHRLRSFRIKIDMEQYWVIRSVVDSCPNLEELHVHGKRDVVLDDIDEDILIENSILEFLMLKQLTKLRTLTLDMREVDLKFLKMFDPEIPEVKALGKLNCVQMTIKQLIRYQFEITNSKSSNKREFSNSIRSWRS